LFVFTCGCGGERWFDADRVAFHHRETGHVQGGRGNNIVESEDLNKDVDVAGGRHRVELEIQEDHNLDLHVEVLVERVTVDRERQKKRVLLLLLLLLIGLAQEIIQAESLITVHS